VGAISHDLVACESPVVFLREAVKDICCPKLMGGCCYGDAPFVIHVVNISVEVAD